MATRIGCVLGLVGIGVAVMALVEIVVQLVVALVGPLVADGGHAVGQLFGQLQHTSAALGVPPGLGFYAAFCGAVMALELIVEREAG